MGSDQRFDYSVMGDTVNLASRLEGQSKTYGVSVVISQSTRARLGDWAVIELDLLVVKGKAEAIRIYALLGNEMAGRSAAFAALAARHADMLDAYRRQRWADAQSALEDCRPLEPRLAGLYALYAARIAAFAANPPPPDWQGFHVAESK